MTREARAACLRRLVPCAFCRVECCCSLELRQPLPPPPTGATTAAARAAQIGPGRRARLRGVGREGRCAGVKDFNVQVRVETQEMQHRRVPVGAVFVNARTAVTRFPSLEIDAPLMLRHLV